MISRTSFPPWWRPRRRRRRRSSSVWKATPPPSSPASASFKSAISDLQTILKELNKPELFQKRSASTSDEKFATATATKDALPGIYKLEVTQLASVSKVATASFADGYKTTSGGTLTIKQGADDAGVTVNVAAGATLAEVRDSLNAQLKDKGITANIVNNPGDGTSRLVFTGKDSGAGKDVFVQGSSGLENFNIGSVGADGKLTLSQLDGTSSSSSGYITQAKNAKFSIDGLTLESPTNTVDKVINGVTFEPEDGHRHQQADHHLGRAGPWRRQGQHQEVRRGLQQAGRRDFGTDRRDQGGRRQGSRGRCLGR